MKGCLLNKLEQVVRRGKANGIFHVSFQISHLAIQERGASRLPDHEPVNLES